MGLVSGCGLCLGSAVLVCCQVDQRESYRSTQMTDHIREEEHVTLLGEEGLRAGGLQSLKLGYGFIHYHRYFTSIRKNLSVIFFTQIFL